MSKYLHIAHNTTPVKSSGCYEIVRQTHTHRQADTHRHSYRQAEKILARCTDSKYAQVGVATESRMTAAVTHPLP